MPNEMSTISVSARGCGGRLARAGLKCEFTFLVSPRTWRSGYWPARKARRAVERSRKDPMRNLAPVIQERILALPATSSLAAGVNERLLRGMAQRWDWREQMRMWEELEGALRKR